MYNIKAKVVIVANSIIDQSGLFVLFDSAENFLYIDINKEDRILFEIQKKVKDILGVSIRYDDVGGWVDCVLYDIGFEENDFCLTYKVILPEKIRIMNGEYQWLHLDQAMQKSQEKRQAILKAIKIL